MVFVSFGAVVCVAVILSLYIESININCLKRRLKVFKAEVIRRKARQQHCINSVIIYMLDINIKEIELYLAVHDSS
jgi:hypothetical protein